MGKIIYFDICAVPVFFIILYTTVYRKMIKGRSNILYLGLLGTSALAVLGELTEKLVYLSLAPGQAMSTTGCVSVFVLEAIYFIARNGTNLIYIFFVISVTGNWFKFRGIWRKLLLSLPYLGIVFLVFYNIRTGIIYTIDPYTGYQRGPQILIVYLFAMFYMVFGTTYLIIHRRSIDTPAWLSLMSMYILNLICVLIQYLYSQFLIECFATSMTMLFVVLFVQRPEKQIDITTGLRSYQAFCDEMKKVTINGQQIRVIIVKMTNAGEMNRFLGENAFLSYILSIEEQIRIYAKKERVSYELYYEHPGNFYILMEDMEYNPVQIIPDIRENVRKTGESVLETGISPDIRIVTVDYPTDIASMEELFRFAHAFVRFADVDRIYSRASSIISRKEYQVEAHMDEILSDAISKGQLQIEYVPFCQASDGSVVAAEARCFLENETHGLIDQNLLWSSAEERGLAITLGNYILEQVFSFVGSDAFKNNAFSYVALRLSVNQCMKMNLTDTIWNLRERYKVHPQKIEFLIRESAYENMSSILDENLEKLSLQGYRIALDGFGKGYSNLQHILAMPVKTVLLDPGMIESATTPEGRALLKGSIRMLREIPLEVGALGADKEETIEMLREMGCDLIPLVTS